ncbi:uncharacterized protein LOC113295903 [Papaver somniferum]|uniref:uncharacterized protein LOC113295903 n=1 Tax=Papaver somniferum TaxID=3469 RepID=UPI000E70494B|nr:uncharacterized protein LOC113295903 [Papaver somniferum]
MEALTSLEIESLIAFLNLEKTKKKEQKERKEFQRLRVENDEEFQLWMRKLDSIDVRRHREKLQQRGEWKCSWGKTRSAIESDSEDEEKNCEGGEDEESSDDSMKRDERAKEAEKNQRKWQEFEDAMYKCYLAEKKNNPRKFARTIESEDEEEETEDDDLQGAYTSSYDNDGTGACYEEDELNYNSNSNDDSW